VLAYEWEWGLLSRRGSVPSTPPSSGEWVCYNYTKHMKERNMLLGLPLWDTISESWPDQIFTVHEIKEATEVSYTRGLTHRINSRADPQDSAGAVPLESCGQVCKVGAFVADGYPITRKTRQVSGVSKADASCAHGSWKKEKERMIINMLRPLSLPCARCISSTQVRRTKSNYKFASPMPSDHMWL
jgi:hypothetical protein